uniref:Uncharacterized protein n=1 Tax=Ciona intestinalis TaxID=7719 RepID=F7BDR6_CIOIN
MLKDDSLSCCLVGPSWLNKPSVKNFGWFRSRDLPQDLIARNLKIPPKTIIRKIFHMEPMQLYMEY